MQTKFAGIWPLPGGSTEQLKTLRAILEKIRASNTTHNELLDWFMSQYGLTGQSGPNSQLLYLRRFGFFREENRRLVLSQQANDFLNIGDKRIVFQLLNENVLGFDDLLLWLAEGPMTREDARKKFTDKYPELSWTTSTQPYVRLTWLLSFGYVELRASKYMLTDEGRKALAVGEPSKPKTPDKSSPSAVPLPEKLKRYLDHAQTIVAKHPSLNEQDTISTLIEPLLEALNWNLKDPESVRRGYPIEVGERKEYADIVLLSNNRPVVLIEAKSISIELKDHLAEQPLKYALNENVPWSILTNGNEWRIYNAHWRLKGIENKMLLSFSIADFANKIRMVELLSRESITSGELDKEAMINYTEKATIDWLLQRISYLASEIVQSHPTLKEEQIVASLNKIIGRSS